MIVEAKNIDTAFGGYIRSKNNCVGDLGVVNQIDNFREIVLKQFKPIYSDKILRTNFGEKAYVSIKVDGANAYAVWDRNAQNKLFFCNSPYHRIWAGLKANIEFEKIMEKSDVDYAIFAGEMFAAPVNKYGIDFEGRSQVQDFMKCQRNPQSEGDLDRIGFKVFDIVNIEHKKWDEMIFKERFSKLKEIFSENGRISIVRTFIVGNLNVKPLFDQVVINGNAEGLVVRNPNNNKAYKIKEKHTIDACIIGITTALFRNQEGVDSVLLALRGNRGKYYVIGQVNAGPTYEERYKLLYDLELVSIQGLLRDKTDKGKKFKMVKPTCVVELNFIDFGAKQQSTLNFNKEQLSWKIEPPDNFYDVKFSWIKLRQDKRADIFDIRSSQMEDLIFQREQPDFCV
jgi:ATP-dependent DNA ligase